jgi:hypothetical protein
LLLSPFVLAELDYLLATRVGLQAELALLAEVGRGAYRLEPFEAADVAMAEEVIETYADLEVGLADASIVVLSRRHEVLDLLTLDERHFRTLRGSADPRTAMRGSVPDPRIDGMYGLVGAGIPDRRWPVESPAPVSVDRRLVGKEA